MSHESHMTHHTLEGSVHAKGLDSQRDVKESVTPEALVATLQGTSRVSQYVRTPHASTVH